MKKHLIVLLAVLICFLSACQTASSETPEKTEQNSEISAVEPDLKNEFPPLTLEERYSSCALEEKTFFLRDEQVYCLESEKEKLLWSPESEGVETVVSDLFVWNENLFFITRNYSDSASVEVWKLDLQKEQGQRFVWEDLATYPMYTACMRAGKLYLNMGFELFSFDLETEQWSSVLSDVERFAFWKESLLYVDKMQKTFTVYSYDLKSEEQKVLLGDGIHESSPEPDVQYRDVVVLGDKLFFTQWFPKGIYCYSEGGNELISESFIDYSLFTYNENLYYVFRNAEGVCELKQYNPQIKETKSVCELKGFDRFSGVRNGILCYRTEDEACYLDLNAF